MPRFGVDQRWRNAAARSLIGLRSGSKTLGSASCVANSSELLKRVDQRQRVVADKVQLVPQSIELGGLSIIQHQSPQLIVFAMEQGQRHDLVHRHDLGVAQRRRKQLRKSSKAASMRLRAALPSPTMIGVA